MSHIEVQATRFSAALKRYGGFSEHTLILYCKKHLGEVAKIVF